MAETWKVFFPLSLLFSVISITLIPSMPAISVRFFMLHEPVIFCVCVCVLMLRLRFYALEIHLNVCQHSLEYGNQLNKQHKKLTNRCDKDNMFHSRRPRSMFMCVLAFFLFVSLARH